MVWVPLKITLLSNLIHLVRHFQYVWVPLKITLLSNQRFCGIKIKKFEYHWRLHYSQTWIYRFEHIPKFEYHWRLHYSQTTFSQILNLLLFEYHWRLHYSQTGSSCGSYLPAFEYHWRLHYSQTKVKIISKNTSLSTIEDYTTLKLIAVPSEPQFVWVPLKITLLSNDKPQVVITVSVWVPLKITLLSNSGIPVISATKFEYHWRLHYSQT